MKLPVCNAVATYVIAVWKVVLVPLTKLVNRLTFCCNIVFKVWSNDVAARFSTF
jgi:hypothetical protein